MREIYIEPNQYAALIAALMNLKPANPFGGGIEEGDIMTALGQGANLWPSWVQDDPAHGFQLKRASHQRNDLASVQSGTADDDYF